MAQPQDFIANNTVNGLGTFALGTAPVAGIYFINGQLSIPTQVDGGGVSQVISYVNKNGVAVYSGVAGATGFQTTQTLAAADVITITLSSSATPDQSLNVIKGVVTMNYGAGQ